MIRRDQRVKCPLGGGRVLWVRWAFDHRDKKYPEAIGVRVDRTGLETVFTPEEIEPEKMAKPKPPKRAKGASAMVRRLELLRDRLNEAEDDKVVLVWSDGGGAGIVVDRRRMRNAVEAMIDMDVRGKGVVAVSRVRVPSGHSEIHMQCSRTWMKIHGTWGHVPDMIEVDFITAEIVDDELEERAAVGA